MIHQILTVPELHAALRRAELMEYRAKAAVVAKLTIDTNAWPRFARAAADRRAIARLLRYVSHRPERTV